MKALIFDTETTGLLPPSIARDNYQPRIIEFFGHIIDDDGSSIRELEFFCNPGIEISENVRGRKAPRSYAACKRDAERGRQRRWVKAVCEI
jgi:hypothetical protein